MKIKQILIIIFLQINLCQIFSQNLTELELIYSPVLAKLSSHTAENSLFHSVGFEFKQIHNSKFYIDGGLYFRRLGNRFELPRSIISTGPYKVTYVTSSIDIPVNIGYYFLEQKKIRMGIEVGLNNGFLLKQRGKSLGETNEIGIYRKYFLGVISSIELGYKINSKFIINVRPNWLQQINRNNGPFKQKAIGIAIGVVYRKE